MNIDNIKVNTNLLKENEALKERIKELEDVLKDYESWEADIINEDKLWFPNTAKDVMSGHIYDTMMVLQEKRNKVLNK